MEWTTRSLPRLLTALGGLAAGALASTVSCIQADPNHCKHRGGDEFCGAGMYCDGCLSSEDNDGCVEAVPDEGCRASGDVAGDDDGSTGTPITDDGGPGSTGDDVADDGDDGDDDDPSDGGASDSTTGPPSACTAEGELDDACPTAAPYCVSGSCATCDDAGGDGFCGGLGDGSTPACGPYGACTQCSVANIGACEGDTPFCNPDGECSGCFLHDQCAPAGCDIFTGTCLSTGRVWWVDSVECVGGSAFGTEDQPYCDLDDAASNVGTGEQGTIHVFSAGSTYTVNLRAIGAGSVIVLLGEDGRPVIGSDAANTVTAAQQGRLYAESVDLRPGDEATVRCSQGGHLHLRDADVGTGSAGQGGIDISDCTLLAERVVVFDAPDTGILAQSGSHVRLEASAVVSNGSPSTGTHGVRLVDSDLEATFSTFVQNAGAGPGIELRCEDGSTASIRNSIIMRAGGDSIDCPRLQIESSVVDDESLASDTVEHRVFESGWFVSPSSGNVHLLNPGDTPFQDRAVWQIGDPRSDLDNQPYQRIPGAIEYAGCDDP